MTFTRQHKIVEALEVSLFDFGIQTGISSHEKESANSTHLSFVRSSAS